MNVTSMLSNGYLRPQGRVSEARQASPRGAEGLALQEAQILAQENALKSASGGGAQVSVTYKYTVGPDGRRYVTGATVEIKGDEKSVDRVGGGTKRKVLDSPDKTSPKPSDPAGGKGSAPSKAQGEQDQAVAKLKQTEREVIAHEAAHQAAGGRFAGAVSYSYTRGPDGKNYVTGGEVPINVPASDDPEQTLSDMAQVQRAALAPGSPSGQDLSVAANAAAAAAQARTELMTQRSEGQQPQKGLDAEEEAPAFKSGAGSVLAGMRFQDIHDGKTESPFSPQDKERALFPEEPEAAYKRSASPQGLWALGQGFAPGEGDSVSVKKAKRGDPFEVAA